jgi:hypothetical protein
MAAKTVISNCAGIDCDVAGSIVEEPLLCQRLPSSEPVGRSCTGVAAAAGAAATRTSSAASTAWPAKNLNVFSTARTVADRGRRERQRNATVTRLGPGSRREDEVEEDARLVHRNLPTQLEEVPVTRHQRGVLLGCEHDEVIVPGIRGAHGSLLIGVVHARGSLGQPAHCGSGLLG